jgi:Uma2 family endonuclease
MTAPATAKLKPNPAADLIALVDAIEPDTRRLFSGITWDEYKQLSKAFPDSSKVRLAYCEGELEIMSISYSHEKVSRFISALLRILALELKFDLEESGSTTLTLDPKKTSAEPDTAFYIHHAKQMVGRKNINLQTDPPPDVVLEVDITNPTHNKEKTYARFGVPELWRYDGARFTIRSLQKGKYRDASQSLAFPFLTADILTEFLEASEVDGQSSALSAFLEWVRVNAKG